MTASELPTYLPGTAGGGLLTTILVGVSIGAIIALAATMIISAVRRELARARAAEVADATEAATNAPSSDQCHCNHPQPDTTG